MPNARLNRAARAVPRGRLLACALLLAAGCRPAPDAVPDASGATAARPAGPSAPAGASDFATAPDGQAELRRVQAVIVQTAIVDEASLGALRALHARWPDEEAVTEALEGALERRGDSAGLIALYEGLPVRSPERTTRYGSALIDQGRYEEAAAVLVPLADADPFDLDVLILAARAELRQGDAAAAARRLDPALGAIRSYGLVAGLLVRAEVALAEGNPGRARALYEEVLAIDDALSAREAYVGLGQALQQLGEEALARETFARLDALERGNTRFVADRQQAHQRLRAVVDAWEAGDAEAAAPHLDALLGGGAETLSLEERRVIDEYAEAVYRRLGRTADADAAATRVAERAP